MAQDDVILIDKNGVVVGIAENPLYGILVASPKRSEE